MTRRFLICLLICLPFGVQAQQAPHWQTVQDKSVIEWTAYYAGKPIKGLFPDFEADIALDPGHSGRSLISVRIPTVKVKTADGDAQANLPQADWLASEKYPFALFKAEHIVDGGEGKYKAEGTLTLRDKTVPVMLPFTLVFSGENNVHASVDAETLIRRLDFGIGEGEWAKPDVVADEVKITIHLEADKIRK